MAEEATKSAFKIDGEEYPIPELGTFDMDEALILYEQCGLALEDFAYDEDDPVEVDELNQKIKHPGFIRSLMIVAYMRGNKGTTKQKAAAFVGRANLFEAVQDFFGSLEAENPTSPQKSEPSTSQSPGNSDEKTESSGTTSPVSSEELVKTPEPTGTTESLTSQV